MSYPYEKFDGLGKVAVIDVETTGLDSEKDRIVSVAVFRVDLSNPKLNEDLKGELLDYIIDPQRTIPKVASNVHGITNADVKGELTFSEIAKEVRDFIGTLPLVGHNVSFDKRFLSAEFKRVGVKTLHRNKSYCTMYRYRQWNNGIRKGSSLDAVATQFCLQGRRNGKHSALEDVTITAKIAALYVLQDRGKFDPGDPPGFPKREQTHKPTQTSKNSFLLKLVFMAIFLLIAWVLFDF